MVKTNTQSDGYLYNGESAPRYYPQESRSRETGLMRRALDYLGLSTKSAPQYPSGPTSSVLSGFTGWGWDRWKSSIDYTHEVGDLDQSSLVMAVVNWTGTQLPEAKPVVLKPGENKALEPDWGNAGANIIRRPNPFNVWANYCGAISLSWWIDGNVYFKMERGVDGQVVELWYLPHFMVTERWPGDGKTPEVPTSGKNKATNTHLSHYQYAVPGKEPQLFKREDMLHIKRFVDVDNPRCGVGAFGPVISEIYGDGKAGLFAATILKNMGIMVPLFTPKDSSITINKTDAEAIKEAWVLGTTGENIGKPFVNSIQLDVTKFAFSPQELDLKELRKVPESRISAVTGIPAAVLGFLVGLEHGHYGASYREAREQAYESVVIPIQSDIAEQLTWQLLPEFDDTKGAEYAFDVSKVRVLQSDRDEEYKRVREAYTAGAITMNQLRASLDKPSVPEGDIYLIPSTATPMTPDQLTARADGTLAPVPVAPPIDAASLAKFADMERMFESLESQMKGFEVPK